MAERKTSAEIEREKATEGALDNLLDGAFADANTMKKQVHHLLRPLKIH